MAESGEQDMTEEELAAARLSRRMRRLMTVMILGVLLLTILPVIVIWFVKHL